MSVFKYRLANSFLIAVPSAIYYFVPPFAGLLLVLAAMGFQFNLAQRYFREEHAKSDYLFLIVACFLFLLAPFTPFFAFYPVCVAGGVNFYLFALTLYLDGEKEETKMAVDEAVAKISEKMGRNMTAIVGELEKQLKDSIPAEEANKREMILREKLEQLESEQSQTIAELENYYAGRITSLQSENDSKSKSELQRIAREKDIEISKIKEQASQMLAQVAKLKETNSGLLQENREQKERIAEHENTISTQKEMLKELGLSILKMNKELDEAKSETKKAEAVNELLERNIKIMNHANPEKYKKKKTELKKRYKNIRNQKVLDFIATGEIHYEITKEMIESDCSAIIIEYAKSVETLFIDILKAKNLYRAKDETRPLFNLMEDYVDNEKYAKIWDNDFRERLNEVRTIRNPAAHKEAVSYEDAMKLRTIVLGGGKRGIDRDGLIAYMDSILRYC